MRNGEKDIKQKIKRLPLQQPFSLIIKLYKKRVFKACETWETAVYYDVNEDFEGKRNAENTLLDNFITSSVSALPL